MKLTVTIAALSAMILSGCGAGGTGAGAGAGYTPVVDYKHVTAAYQKDLQECRALATQVQANREKEVVGNALAGALLGAGISAALGGDSNYGARYGAVRGGLSSAGNAVQGGKQIVTNCLIGRGHRVLG